MAERKKIKISRFLKEREGKYAPNDEAVQGLKRLNKIDFAGEIHLSDKGSKTGMIIVEPGDLVISGINVSKGALAVYHGEEPIAATIHYSSYIFDESRINIDYFKRFVKSQSFVQALKDQVKGGIKTEIKPKHFLPLEIHLPDIDSQKEIVSFFKKIENEMNDLSGEIERQESCIKQLRQQVLQEAIEGKLTAEWRKQNPALIGGDNHASKLLEKIKAEKERLINEGEIKNVGARRAVSLPPITDTDPPAGNTGKPFNLPEGWVWCRLGEVIVYSDNLDIHKKLKPNTIINYVDIDSIDNKHHKIGQIKIKKISELSSRARRVLKKGYIVYSTVRPYLENIAFVEEDIENLIGSTGFNVFKPVHTNHKFIFHLLLSPYINNLYKEMMIGFNSPSITNDQFENTLIPLPPIAEQRAVFDRVDKLMAMIDDLEKQISKRKGQSEMLMQSVLREAFE